MSEKTNNLTSENQIEQWIIAITPAGGVGFLQNLEPPGAQGTT